MSASNVMTIEEMIKLAFQDKDTNVVNFNLVRTLLHLFARQLQVLVRKVEVKLDTPYYGDFIVSAIKITEVKIHASTSCKLNANQGKLKTKVLPKKKRCAIKESGRFKASYKKALWSKGPSTNPSSQPTTRALKFSEDVYSQPPSNKDSIFLYRSPRFSDSKHCTSKSSVVDSMATIIPILGDTEQDLPLRIEQLRKESKSGNSANDKNVEKITHRKESQAKSFDTLLYKIDTQTSLVNKRFSAATAKKSINVPNPQSPRIIIKHIPHANTDTDDNVTTKKIVILRKIRKRVNKHKPKKFDSNINFIPSDDSSEINYVKYRLSTEPYLDEDFVPVDIIKQKVSEEKDFRENKLEADDIIRHSHIRFSIANVIHSNKDNNLIQSTIANQVTKKSEEVEKQSMKGFSKDSDRQCESAEAYDDKNQLGTSTRYSVIGSHQVQDANQQYLGQETLSSQDKNQLGKDRGLKSVMIKRSVESDRDTLDKGKINTSHYDDQSLDHKVQSEDGILGSLDKGTKSSSKDQLSTGINTDDDQYKLSQSSQYTSTDFGQDMLAKNKNDFNEGSDEDKKYTGINYNEGILSKSIRSIVPYYDTEIPKKNTNITNKYKAKKYIEKDDDFDSDMEEKYTKGIRKDDDETKLGKKTRRLSKDTRELNQGLDYDDDQYKLDKCEIARSKERDHDDFGKSARTLSKDVDRDTAKDIAKDSAISRLVSDQDRSSKIEEESLKRIKSHTNKDKYKVKVGKTPDVYSQPPSNKDSIFLYRSPRFSDSKHCTSKSSVVDSMATIIPILGDTEQDLPLRIEQLRKESKSGNSANDKNVEKITHRKESQAKSFDTLLYKIDTQTSLVNKRFSAATAKKSINVPNPQSPRIIIKHIPHANTDTDDNVTTKKIVILRKIRKRVNKHKPKKFDSNINFIPSDDSSEINYVKYRLSTEPYLDEDFVPVDIIKQKVSEEKDFRENKLEADDIIRHSHIRFSIANVIHSNKDNNLIQSTIANQVTKKSEEVEKQSMKGFSKDSDRQCKSAEAYDDKNQLGTSTRYSVIGSHQVQDANQQYLGQETLSSQDKNQLGKDRGLKSVMIKRSVESDRDTLDKGKINTSHYDDQSLDHKVQSEDGILGSLDKGTKSSSKDQLSTGINTDDDQYKLSQSSQYTSTDFGQDMLAKNKNDFNEGSDEDKKYTGINYNEGILSKSIRSIVPYYDTEIPKKNTNITNKYKAKKYIEKDDDFDSDMEEKYTKGIRKDDDETKLGKKTRRLSKDTRELNQGLDYDDDQYKLDKCEIARSKERDHDDFGKSARTLSKDVDRDTAKDIAKDSAISRLVSDQDRSSKIEEESLKRIKSHTNKDKYKVKVGKTPDSLRERILIVEKTPSELESGRISKFPFVTQEEFARLEDEFQDLQKILHSNIPKSWQDQKLMELLSKSTTTIDPMAALQLSASLESTENMIEALSNILVSFAQQFPGSIDENVLTELLKSVSKAKQLRSPVSTAVDNEKDADEDEIKYVYGQVVAAAKKNLKSTAIGGFPIRIEDEVEETHSFTADFGSQFPIGRFQTPYTTDVLAKQTRGDEQGRDARPSDLVTVKQLESAGNNLTMSILKECVNKNKLIADQVDNIVKDIKEYEEAIKSVSNVTGRLEDVNTSITHFAKAVNEIERHLTTTMSSHMEDLMELQYSLEKHVESMTEALANVQGDPEAVADFGKRLNLFAEKRMAMHDKQIETESEQKELAFSLEKIRLLVLALKSDKYERSNFAALLQNLVNMSDMNTLIAHDTFEATWNDLDRKIFTAFSTFDEAEHNWQERITHLVQQLNGKADSSDISLLFNNIEMRCKNLLSQLIELSAIVHHDPSEGGSRHIIRDANCLSCRTEPADPDKVVTKDRGEGEPSKLSPSCTNRKETLHFRGQSHVRPCYPGEPISHALDPRAKFCPHYCGGDAKPFF